MSTSEDIGTCSTHNLHALHRHSFFRHWSHYAKIDFTIVQDGAPLTSSAALKSLMSCNRLGFGGSELLCALDLVAVVLEVLDTLVDVGLVGVAISGPTLLCLVIFFLR